MCCLGKAMCDGGFAAPEESLGEDSGGHREVLEKATDGAKQSGRWELDSGAVGQGGGGGGGGG